MRRVLFLIVTGLFFEVAHGEGPLYRQTSPSLQLEFENIYQQLRTTTGAESSDLIVNVKNFGALGDGTTDDSAAFNAAIAYATTNFSGGLGGSFGVTIYAPAGHYRLSITITTNTPVSILGDAQSTWFQSTSTTAFCLNYLGSSDRRRFISNIIFPGNELYRGVYFNFANFMSIQNCQFRSLEYGVYSNSSEWTHVFNTTFYNISEVGYFATTKDNDILGNNPISDQNSAASWFTQCGFWTNKVGFYGDDPDNAVGDHQAAWSFNQCEFLTNSVGIAIVMPANSNRFYPLSLDYVWFEANTVDDGAVIVNGNTLAPDGNYADIYVKGATVNLNNVVLSGAGYFLDQSRVNADNTNFNDASFNVSTNTLGSMNNILADKQTGMVLDWAYVENLQSFNTDRPVLARVKDRAAFTLNASYKNVLSTNTTASGAFGTLPTVSSGAASVSYFFGDGFYANKCIKVTGQQTGSVRFTAAVDSSKYYATTFAIRKTTATATISTFTIINNTNIIVPTQQNIQMAPEWRTYGAIGQPSGTGSATLDFQLNTDTTFYLSALQVVEFTTLQDAKAFLNSDTYILRQNEVEDSVYLSSITATSTALPASGSYGDLLSLTLTPGVWSVSGLFTITANGATVSNAYLGINTVAGNSCSGCVNADNFTPIAPPSATVPYDVTGTIPDYKISVPDGSGTIVYLKMRGVYTVATPRAWGKLIARRVDYE